jgi:hypothetical protein
MQGALGALLRVLVDEVELLGAEVRGVEEVAEAHHHTAQLGHGEGLIHLMDEVALESHVSTSIHGTRARQKPKVQQREDDDGAKTRFAFDYILPRQVRPVLFD